VAEKRPGWFENRALDQLTTAINLGETEKALSLIKPGMPLDAVAKGQHRSPLFAAIEAGNTAVLEALIAAGASLAATNDMGEMPLHAAARGDEALVAALVARGAPVNAQIVRQKGHQYDGVTPLMIAATANNLANVKILLEHGADPFMKNGSGMTALSWAEIFGKRAANHLRKVMGKAPASSDLGLHDAARAGLIERVQALLEQGTAIDARDDMGRTALHWAVIGGNADLVRVLLDRGATVDARDAHNNPPLLFADKLDTAQLLLASGADPNADVGNGLTTFLYQARTGRPEVLGALVDAGANLEARTGDGQSVLEYAKPNRHAARRVLKDRMGLGADAIDLLRAEMKELPRLAALPAFEAAAARLGELFNRKPAPWKRRKGVVYFHNVAIVKHLAAHFGEPVESGTEGERLFSLLAKLQDQILAEGFTLVFVDSIPDDGGRLPLILLPTPNKYAALLACGTNGINKGHDTEAVISWLMAMEAENPFILAGCGHDFLDGRIAGTVKNAEPLAERMIAFCPDMVDQAERSLSSLSRPDQAVALARQLTESGWFGFWWD
jgi:ankyrin repeat protein